MLSAFWTSWNGSHAASVSPRKRRRWRMIGSRFDRTFYPDRRACAPRSASSAAGDGLGLTLDPLGSLGQPLLGDHRLDEARDPAAQANVDGVGDAAPARLVGERLHAPEADRVVQVAL